jgi:hypothetical protein
MVSLYRAEHKATTQRRSIGCCCRRPIDGVVAFELRAWRVVGGSEAGGKGRVKNRLGCDSKEVPMNAITKRGLFWTPRVLGILFAVLISMLALDVFSEGYGFWGTILALLIHLVPTYIVVIALVIAWRWEWVGAILFTALAMFYVVWTWGRFPWVTYLSISGPLVLMGALFLLNWLYRAQLRAR